MTTQIFKPEIVSNKKEIGNSIYWKYSYDGNIIRFFYGEEQKPRIEGKFNSSICVFVADGKNSKFSSLKAPKNKIMKEFWKRCFCKGHFSESRFTAYGYYKFCKDPYYSRPEDILSNKWQRYEDGEGIFIFKDMTDKKGKLIASAYLSYTNRINRWFWFDKELFTEELCKEFFDGCPIDIRWNI